MVSDQAMRRAVLGTLDPVVLQNLLAVVNDPAIGSYPVNLNPAGTDDIDLTGVGGAPGYQGPGGADTSGDDGYAGPGGPDTSGDDGYGPRSIIRDPIDPGHDIDPGLFDPIDPGHDIDPGLFDPIDPGHDIDPRLFDPVINDPAGLDLDDLQDLLDRQQPTLEDYAPLQEALTDVIMTADPSQHDVIQAYLDELKQITDEGGPDMAKDIYELTEKLVSDISGDGPANASVEKLDATNADLADKFGVDTTATPQSDFQLDPNMTALEKMDAIANEVMAQTEGDVGNKYRDAAREYKIDMAELQDKLDNAAGDPALEQAIKEEMAIRANQFANDLNEPTLEWEPNPDHPSQIHGPNWYMLEIAYHNIPPEFISKDITPGGIQHLGNLASGVAGDVAGELGVTLPEPEPIQVSLGDDPFFMPDPYLSDPRLSHSILYIEPDLIDLKGIYTDNSPPPSIDLSGLKEYESGSVSPQFSAAAANTEFNGPEATVKLENQLVATGPKTDDPGLG